MYESKYNKYIIKNNSRFAEESEIIKSLKSIKSGAAGVPILYKNGELFVDDEDNHSLIIGPTGCKKSRVIGFSTVATIIENGESAIINDPKGELYKRTSNRAKILGGDVFVLNLRTPRISDTWNVLGQIYDLYTSGYTNEAQGCIDEIATALISQVRSDNDKYWENSVKAFLSALIYVYMLSCPNKEYFNLKNILPLCYEENRSKISALIKHMEEASGIVTALRSVVDVSADKTRSCLYGVLQSAISVLVQNEGVLNILSGSDSIDFSNFGKRQSLLYIIYPDEKQGMDFIVNMIVTQSYQILLHECNTNKNDRLNIRVNYVLDEFSNLVPVERFDNRISESRSKNIRYFLFVQSYQQLKQKYDSLAETIISNCNNWICFSSKDMDFLNKIASICGKEVDYNGIEHDLISPFHMQYLQKKQQSVEVLIIKQGQFPFITGLPDFDYTSLAAHYSTNFLSDRKSKKFESKWIISPETWLEKISQGEFRLPLKKESNIY